MKYLSRDFNNEWAEIEVNGVVHTVDLRGVQDSRTKLTATFVYNNSEYSLTLYFSGAYMTSQIKPLAMDQLSGFSSLATFYYLMKTTKPAEEHIEDALAALLAALGVKSEDDLLNDASDETIYLYSQIKNEFIAAGYEMTSNKLTVEKAMTDATLNAAVLLKDAAAINVIMDNRYALELLSVTKEKLNVDFVYAQHVKALSRKYS